MSRMLPLSEPHIGGNAWKYVKDCLDTKWVSSTGKYVDLFEEEIKKYTGVKYAIACVNGTAALHVSLLVAGVSPGDEVIVPTLTFISPVNTIRYCGAYPVFMDSDSYFNIDVKKTIEFLKNETIFKNNYTINKKSKRRITAMIPVHIFGNAVLLDKLYKICKEKNIKIIEDATESLGTKYIKGKFCGQHTGAIGDLGCLSFNGNKIITTGGGGMILTNQKRYALKAKYLTTQAKDDIVKYIHNEIGYNYRLTNLQAALGIAQLEQIPDILKIKKNNFKQYQQKINKIHGIQLVQPPEYSDNNHWLYTIKINKEHIEKDIDDLLEIFSSNKIQTRPIWYPNHLQVKYSSFQTYKIEKAIKLWQQSLNIPSSVDLKMDDIEKVCQILKKL